MSWNSSLVSYLSYLRMPFLAGSGLTAMGSLLLYFRQNDLIYPASLPAGSRTDVPEPARFGIQNADSLEIDTPDGETLHAYLLRPQPPPPSSSSSSSAPVNRRNTRSTRRNLFDKPVSSSNGKPRCTIITFHGNAGNVGHRLPIGKVLSESLGCYCLMAEYRGYGRSTGAPSEDGLTIDGQTVLDYVRKHPELRDTRIVVYGQSLGGAVTIKLVQANQHVGDISGVILENTFTSIRKLIPHILPVARWISGLCHQTWKSDETLARISAKSDIPFLFLSGLQDEIVPPEMMRTLYSICPSPRKSWQEFPNGSHNDTVAESDYFDSIWSWLVREVVPGETLKISAPIILDD